MDHPGTELFYQLVSEMRIEMHLSIILVSHDLAAASSVADRLVFLNHTVICDGPAAVVLQSPTVRETFGLDHGTVYSPIAPCPVNVSSCSMEGKGK